MTAQTEKNKIEIEKQMTAAGLSFTFSGLSETNGISIYYEVNGVKFRFSNHSVTNKDRVFGEKHFDLPFQVSMGMGGVVKEKHIAFSF